MRFSRTVCAGLAALLLAACQGPPPGPSNPALAPVPDAPGLTVMPLDGLPPPQAEAAARAMAEALAQRNIPAATAGANVKSRFVAGLARVEPAAGGARRVRAGWRLLARDGALLGTHQAAVTVPAARWDRADWRAFRPLAEGAAARFAALIQAPDVPAAPPPAPAGPRLHVWPVEGAPGGRNDILRREMQGALRRHGHVLTESIERDTLVVSGTVELGPVRNGARALNVTWAVLDWRGRELGTLDQGKRVPAREIETRWPAFAALIAESAAGGMAELLDKARARQAAGGPAPFTQGGGAGNVRPPRNRRPAPAP